MPQLRIRRARGRRAAQPLRWRWDWLRGERGSSVRKVSFLQPVTRAPRSGRLGCSHIRADPMGSFRKRLLVLIIGLALLTQTVTLFAVLASTARNVRARGAEQLRAAGSIVDQVIRYRAGQLASGVAVLAEDFGFREAVASGDGPTMLSAAGNNARRIGADLVLLMDTQGRVLASNAPSEAHVGSSIGGLLLADSGGRRGRPQFMVLGRQTYQFFLAPVRTPEIIAWV